MSPLRHDAVTATWFAGNHLSALPERPRTAQQFAALGAMALPQELISPPEATFGSCLINSSPERSSRGKVPSVPIRTAIQLSGLSQHAGLLAVRQFELSDAP